MRGFLLLTHVDAGEVLLNRQPHELHLGRLTLGDARAHHLAIANQAI